MSHEKRRFVIRLNLMLILVMLLASLMGCQFWEDVPNVVLIENQTSEALTIYVNRFQIPQQVELNKEISVPTGIQDTFDITAKNARGETVFSQEVTLNRLQQVDKHRYKLVIKVPKGAGSSDNTTAK